MHDGARPAPAAQPPGARPAVRTQIGAVRGSWEGGVAVFRGIPFAAPPVGALRFAAPVPPRPWSGVRDASLFGPPPPQGGHLGMDRLAQAQGGDDWLTVNVWSPVPEPGAALPVMVWIQGGGYVVGTAGLPEYDGARLAREGPVVVVTLNYRVGIEGFGMIVGAPPNRGLLDQVAALTWVRDNVRAFGGDPTRVTVFGQSAGGGSVAALLAMEGAAGLFRRAIVQSMPGTYFTPALASDILATCAEELGRPATLAGLRAVDPARLTAVADDIGAAMDLWADRWGQPAHRSIPFAPVVDGAVLRTTPWRALADGAGRDIELVVGHTRHEHRLFMALDGRLGEVDAALAAEALRVFAPDPEGDERYRVAYPEAGPEELYERVHGDWLFRMPSLLLAEAQAMAGGRVHVYELTWPAPGMGGLLGACHGLDVPLVFGNLERGQPAMLIGGPSPEAEAMSASMRAAWSAFATDGDPGWPAYAVEERLVQCFDDPPVVVPDPERASRSIWQDRGFDVLDLVRR